MAKTGTNHDFVSPTSTTPTRDATTTTREAPWFYRRRVEQSSRLVHQCVHLR
jgi:hypothetical protein